ncbi:hypothetical protein [Methyloceanibacter sp.]|uniref:hypothetical protein n=1 Tax=Methyloceanibacter sp. TaxID=1965321 RepID=UPI002D311581|nr:hypothetical protein [Methyloceanibacter sp.]HZP08770.1 hypothetical protein [Methyloceanibacter sp.]
MGLKLAAADHHAEPGEANASDDKDELDKLMALEEAPDGALPARLEDVVAARLPLCD